jgi:4-cresol dehydrogenase (hydroxylating)
MFEFDRLPDFASAVSILRDLIRTGVSTPHDVALWNKAKRVSSMERGAPAVTKAMTEPGMLWGVSIIFSAEHRELLDARLAIITRALETHTARWYSASDRDDDGTRAQTHLTGFSHGANIVSTYAAKPSVGPEPLDPDRDRCGLLWLCPVVPFEARAILAIEGMIAEATHGLPMFGALGLQAVSHRALHAYVSIAWDRDDEATDGRALAIHDALSARLQQAGFLPFRLGHPSIATTAPPAAYSAVVDRIAAALDPRGVMAPGKVHGR